MHISGLKWVLIGVKSYQRSACPHLFLGDLAILSPAVRGDEVGMVGRVDGVPLATGTPESGK